MGLLKSGWDVHIVSWKRDPKGWEHFPELANQKEIRRRVHVLWPYRPFWLVAALMPFAILRCFLHHPAKTWFYLKRGWPKFGSKLFEHLYLDADLIAISPEIISLEFGGLAVGRMHTRDILDSKVVVSFRGYDLNFAGLNDFHHYSEVWEKADALHLLGKDLWNRAQRRGCPAQMPHVLIPPAIDSKFFHPLRRRPKPVAGTMERPLRILSVGRLEWKKGYEFALQAVSMLKAEGIHCSYHIVGDGSFMEPLAFLRHKLGLEKEVKFIGAKTRNGVRNQMNRADVFLHAAVSEGFCNAVLEAQSMALPIVCTDADGLRENIANGKTGFVVPARNPQQLAEKLLLLARDPLLRQEMGTAGRRRVKKKFQLKDQIAAFDRFYQAIIHQKNQKTKLPGEGLVQNY